MASPTSRPTVTVGGLAGTGTSTLCSELEGPLGVPYVYAGGLFREEAARRGLTLAEFNELCETDPAADRSLDDRQLALLRAGGVLLEGRMAGWLAAHDDDVDAFTVWVECEEQERVRRIVGRDGGDLQAQAAATRARERSELDRYRRYHDADILDAATYDLVLDSTATPPDELARTVLQALADAGVPVR